MRRFFFATAIVFCLLTFKGFGQNIYDALRFSQQYYQGTARSLAMGNALTAIGGDMGAVSVNPAATGPYRYTEVVFTPGLYTGSDNSTFLGNDSKNSRTRFILSNVGVISSFSTGMQRGLINMNIGLVANMNNNFASRTSLSGKNAESSYLASMSYHAWNDGYSGNNFYIPEDDWALPFDRYPNMWDAILAWNTGLDFDDGSRSYLLDAFDDDLTDFIGATENIDEDGFYYLGGPLRQRFKNETSGYSQDASINVSGNVSDMFFFGVNFTVRNIWYNQYSVYSEVAEDPLDFDVGFVNFNRYYNQTTSGYGFGLKAGVIFRPIAGLSIGGAISTPTWLRLKDRYTMDMDAEFIEGKTSKTRSPEGFSEYKITSPFVWNLGVGYTFGRFAAVSFDYERTSYSQMKMKPASNNFAYDFSEENRDIKEYFKAVNNFRAGAEVKLAETLSLRAGYSYYGNTEKGFIDERHYASVGFGYASKGGFFIDAAYRQQCNYNKEAYLLYDDYYDGEIPGAEVQSRYRNWLLLLSFGFRF